MKINLPLKYDINHFINIKEERKQFGFCSMIDDDILYYLIYKKKISIDTFNDEKFHLKLSLSIQDFNHTGVAGCYMLVVGKTQFFVLKTFYQGIYEIVDNPFYFDEKKVSIKNKKEQKELIKIKQYLQLQYIYQEKVKLSYILLNQEKIEEFHIANFNTQLLHPDIIPYFEKIKRIYKNFLYFSQAKLNELNFCLDSIFHFIELQLGSKKTKKI
jgi:hypothetical protein